jgi:hypothetical protein
MPGWRIAFGPAPKASIISALAAATISSATSMDQVGRALAADTAETNLFNDAVSAAATAGAHLVSPAPYLKVSIMGNTNPVSPPHKPGQAAGRIVIQVEETW